MPSSMHGMHKFRNQFSVIAVMEFTPRLGCFQSMQHVSSYRNLLIAIPKAGMEAYSLLRYKSSNQILGPLH